MGPILIFDKSFLESLTIDESVWLDNFFMTNITPLFYVETLADLEKNDKKGRVARSPEELVGELANKTPVMATVPNMFHLRLVVANLLGEEVDMSKRPIISGGQYKVSPDGKVAVDFKQFPEAAALERWKRHEFNEIEKEVAKDWRESLSNLSFESLISLAGNTVPSETKLSSLEDVKTFVDDFVKGKHNQLIHFAFGLLDVPEKARRPILKRWYATRLPFDEFASYAAYVLKVDLFFYLCLGKSLISKERPSNKIDISYLYYLPFCMVFASSDNLHARTAPLFMELEQSYVSGQALKKSLKKLNEYYLNLPEKIKERGVMEFATYPPEDEDTLLGEIYDKHLRPTWRESAKKHKEQLGKPKKRDKKFAAELKKRRAEQKPLIGTPPPTDSVDSMTLTRRVPAKKGGWKLFPPEVIEKAKSKS